MIRVKICGLTSLADARAAVEAGADLLGFNFYPPSPRYVAPNVAAEIIAALRAEYGELAVRYVGVVVNMTAEQALALRERCGLDLLQLHGDESVEDYRAVAPGAFKALRPRSAAEAEADLDRFAPPADVAAPHFLIDASHPQLYGGTGATGDWGVARSIAERFPILLAGGLTAENVGAAIAAVRPWGVDVASGVEAAPGGIP